MVDISGIIARQVGSIQGKITAQVQTRVLDMLSKFSNECPTTAELEKMSKERNNLLKAVNSFQSRISTVANVANQLNPIINSLRAAIQVIKSIPIPTAVIPPGTPGGLGIPINVLTRYSDTLIQLNKLLDKLVAERDAVQGITSTATQAVSTLESKLDSLDSIIQECSQNSPDAANILNQIQPKANTGSEGTPTDAQGNLNPDYYYKGYTLEIVQDPNSPEIAPKRYAIAKDKVGIIVLYGPSSFSSDEKVLLDEIKFRIDNQLP